MFVRCVESVAQEKHNSTVFCPTQFRELADKQLLDKIMRELETAHLVMMDVSMEKIGEYWFPDAGVMIEFGLVVKDPSKGLEFLYMFCDQVTERNHLPPMIPRLEITKYDEQKEDELKNYIRLALEKFERAVPEKLRQALQAKAATQIMLQSTKGGSSEYL